MDLTSKLRARKAAKKRRLRCRDPFAAIELIRHFPAEQFRGAIIGAFWPLPDEIDLRLLMQALEGAGHAVGLPCILGPEQPLEFRLWKTGDRLCEGPFNTREPEKAKPELMPNLVLMPLLAFTPDGKRLGYGGGYYDRTLESLRQSHDVFACGVAYAGQETPDLPSEAHDVPLDGILTQDYFKAFT